jgi:hypothetical protein
MRRLQATGQPKRITFPLSKNEEEEEETTTIATETMMNFQLGTLRPTVPSCVCSNSEYAKEPLKPSSTKETGGI